MARKDNKLKHLEHELNQLESGAIISNEVFNKCIQEFYQSDSWVNVQRDLMISTGIVLT